MRSTVLAGGRTFGNAARPRTVRSKPFAPTGREVVELLGASAERDAEVADAAIVLASSGVRKGELLAVRWAEIDLEAKRST
jgi:integrase